MKKFSHDIALIPGFMLNETMWDGFKSHIPQEKNVIHASIDGGSTIKEIAANIANYLPEKTILIGFSLGGYIARQIAADYPEKIAALVLIATSLREDTKEQANSKNHILSMHTTESFKGISKNAIAKALHKSKQNDDELISSIKEMGNNLGYDALHLQSNLSRAYVETTKITCPTLIIASTNDSLRPIEETNELANAIENSVVKFINSSGHMIPLEQPEELAQTVFDWIES